MAAATYGSLVNRPLGHQQYWLWLCLRPGAAIGCRQWLKRASGRWVQDRSLAVPVLLEAVCLPQPTGAAPANSHGRKALQVPLLRKVLCLEAQHGVTHADPHRVNARAHAGNGDASLPRAALEVPAGIFPSGDAGAANQHSAASRG